MLIVSCLCNSVWGVNCSEILLFLGFDAIDEEECLGSPGCSEGTESPLTWQTSDLHHHVLHHDAVKKAEKSTSWMRCINPNHFHHHHHHHEPPTLPITLTHNPIEASSPMACYRY